VLRRDAVKLIVDRWRSSDDDVVFHMCSIEGTHKSVAAAEIIAQKLREKMERNGVAILR
jgi:type IV pilus biogenesis protein CpaD/CtpE